MHTIGYRIPCLGVSRQCMGSWLFPLVLSSRYTYHHSTNLFDFRGLPFSYGVFLRYYSVSSPTLKHSSLTLLTLVGTLNTGILYISSLLLLPVMNHYPNQKKTVMIVGYVLSISGLIGAAYARNAGELILTQGFLFGLGGSKCLHLLMYMYLDWCSYRPSLFPYDDVVVRVVFCQERSSSSGILFQGHIDWLKLRN